MLLSTMSRVKTVGIFCTPDFTAFRFLGFICSRDLMQITVIPHSETNANLETGAKGVATKVEDHGVKAVLVQGVRNT